MPKQPLKERILAILNTETGLTQGHIANQLNSNLYAVARALDVLMKEQNVVREAGGYFGSPKYKLRRQ